MDAYENHDQARVDEAVTALAWAIYKPAHARMLAELAVEDTGLGNIESKAIKNTRKTFGTLRDLMRVRTVGVIEDLPERGLVKYGKPVGVVGAVCPSTNPAATPVNKAMMALKGGNAVIIAPSPAGQKTTMETVRLMRQELRKAGHPEDLVQILPPPVDKALTQALMDQSDLVVVTGSQNNVPPRHEIRHGDHRRRSRQRAGDYRFERRSCGCGAQDLRLENLRQRNLVLVGKRRHYSRRRL